MEGGGAAVAADAGGRHAVDDEAGSALAVGADLAADGDVVDEVVVIDGERNAGQTGQEFAYILGG